MRVKDKVAIVTGGGTGIGKSISLAFAEEGAAVVLAARDFSRLREVAEEIGARGRQARAVQADISDEKQVRAMVSETLDAYGRIDILVNNGGIGAPAANVVDMDLNTWNEVLAINLTGTMLCAREVLKSMIARRSGSIINIGSEAGRSGYPMRSAYSVSKWGVIGLTEGLSIEVGKYNVRVNCISPGAVKGERMDNLIRMRADALGVSSGELMGRLEGLNALERLVDPSEIASAALFLASEESSGITGHTLVVNCGHHIIHPSEIR